jgi:hypothetical protein
MDTTSGKIAAGLLPGHRLARTCVRAERMTALAIILQIEIHIRECVTGRPVTRAEKSTRAFY